MDSVCDWMAHFENWPKNAPICAHAEGRTTAALILLASLYDRQGSYSIKRSPPPSVTTRGTPRGGEICYRDLNGLYINSFIFIRFMISPYGEVTAKCFLQGDPMIESAPSCTSATWHGGRRSR